MMSLIATNRTFAAYFVKLLAVPAVILFLLTVNNLSIVELPANGLYYLKSLPHYYWAGLAVTLASILLPFLLKIRTNDYSKVLSLILLGVYLYGTPTFAYEIPRFMDVFSHGAEALPIISTGFTDPENTYSSEYPNAFILMAVSVITQNIDPFIFFRFIELFILLLVIPLVYLIAKIFTPAYAWVGSLAFMGVFWVDQGHFSPQGIAIPLYLVFFLSLIKTVTTKSSRSWPIMTILTLLALNITSPTNSFFLLFTLSSIVAMGYVISRQRKITNRVLFFAFVCGALFAGWSAYSAESQTILKMEGFGDEITDKFGSVQGIKITPEPARSYLFVNNLRILVTGFVVASGIALSIMLLRSRMRSEYKIIIIGWFATVVLIGISMYISSSLTSRSLMYTLIPWSLLVTSFIADEKKGKLRNVTKIVLMLSIVILVISIPITRYGRDPTTYAPASLINSAELIVRVSDGGKAVANSIGSYVLKYFKSAENGDLEIKPYDRVLDGSVRAGQSDLMNEWMQRETAIPNDKIIFAEPERNIMSMKYSEGDLYESLEDTVQSKYNLVINNGEVRTYANQQR